MKDYLTDSDKAEMVASLLRGDPVKSDWPGYMEPELPKGAKMLQVSGHCDSIPLVLHNNDVQFWYVKRELTFGYAVHLKYYCQAMEVLTQAGLINEDETNQKRDRGNGS